MLICAYASICTVKGKSVPWRRLWHANWNSLLPPSGPAVSSHGVPAAPRQKCNDRTAWLGGVRKISWPVFLMHCSTSLMLAGQVLSEAQVHRVAATLLLSVTAEMLRLHHVWEITHRTYPPEILILRVQMWHFLVSFLEASDAEKSWMIFWEILGCTLFCSLSP